MAVKFNLYFFSQNTGDYLEEVVETSNQGSVTQTYLVPTTSLPDTLGNEADVCFIEFDEAVAGIETWIEKLQHHVSHPAIYLYLKKADTDVLLRALRLGAQECFVRQITPEDFQKAIQRLKKFHPNLNPGEKTEIISVLGCKGGVGVTFVALNLAQGLVSHSKESVLLVDLDLKASNVSAFLDIQTKYTILDVIENFDRIDPQYLKDIIYSRDSGLDILPGPTRMEDGELIQAQQIDQVLEYIQSQNLYRWILLDLGDLLDEISLKALERSDLVLLITLLNIPGLRDAKKIVEMLQLLEFGEEKIKLVVNSHCKDVDIKLAEAKKFMGLDFFGTLRFDHGAVIRSINEGQPLVETQPTHRLSTDFIKLSKGLYPDQNDNGQHGRWRFLNRLLHRKG
jgi:pilus assembly protein CpaE